MLKLSEFRKERGITQKQLADALGVSVKALGSWEQKRAEPCIEDICLLADYFGVTIDELLGRTDDVTGNIVIKGVKLSDEEKLLIDLHRSLSLRDRAELIGFAKGLAR